MKNPSRSYQVQSSVDISNAKQVWNDIQAVVIGVDAAVREIELTWGVGRLVTLVSDDTRIRFQKGHALWSRALQDSDLPAVQTLGPKMIAAWRFMAKESDALGHTPLSPEVWEAAMPDGTVIAIVRTLAEALTVTADGRQKVCYTLDEVAKILHQHTLVETIKREFPGSTIEKVVTYDAGFPEAWATQAPSVERYDWEEV